MSMAVEIYQNEYLTDGADEVHAVIRVISSGGRGPVAATQKAVVLVVDTSGSMDMPRTKIREARRSAASAIGLLPDGTLFALLAGTNVARCVYPLGAASLVVADDTTRAEAVEATRRLRADGGTRMSTWLDLVRTLLVPHQNAIRLAYMVTDGKNEGERKPALDAAIERAVGAFQCDTRGVGADWSPDQLRRISNRLLGDVDIIRSPEEMDEDFRTFMDRAIGRDIADVRLRIWTPRDSRIKLLKQATPDIVDLTPSNIPVNALTSDYPTGAWSGDERRDYHLVITLPPGELGDEILAARASVMTGDAMAGEGLVRAVWTDDLDRSTRRVQEVEACAGREELSEAIQEGLEARRRGDDDAATVRLGDALRLAKAANDQAKVNGLLKIVDDEGRGTVRLKPKVDPLDEVELDTRSTRTVQLGRHTDPVDNGGRPASAAAVVAST